MLHSNVHKKCWLHFHAHFSTGQDKICYCVEVIQVEDPSLLFSDMMSSRDAAAVLLTALTFFFFFFIKC